ncbi:regulatory protein, luxR family [Sinosporangium album]|uniref:Regulatory protein, luxR family n=1 Tax=Sinosporangium album TaxID=504805 RepID=A0A1G8GID0_9ACTN|nr:helix-turn-helix transcriptional regulator [Sinosporangium album]SDH94148.1 regulatory protein, luxR family [Sinosporangium album]
MAERDAQLSRLLDLLEESTGGCGRVALVRGVAGSGKTMLLEEFSTRAKGAVTLSASGSLAERELPLGLLNQLLYHAPLPEGGHASVVQLLLEGALTAVWSDPFFRSVEQARLMHGLWTRLLRMAAGTPLLLVIDDVHHADPASLEYLLYFARRLRSAPIMLVLAELDRPQRVHPLLDADLPAQPHCHRIRLGPLSAEGVAGVLAAHAGEGAAGPADACHRLTGGNPLLVRAYAEDCARGGPAPGEAYGRAVTTCLLRGDPVDVAVARGLAVLDGSGQEGLAHRLAGVDAVTAARSAEALAGWGLLDGGVFRTEAGRHAVLSELEPGERSTLHRRAAALLHEQGTSKLAVAEHLVAAGDAGDDWALPVLVQAAEQALQGDEVERALGCLDLAARCEAAEVQRAAIALTRAKAGWRRDPSAVHRHLPVLVEALRAGTLPAGAAHLVVRFLLWHGRFEEASRSLEHLRAATGEGAEWRTAVDWVAAFCPALLPADVAARAGGDGRGDGPRSAEGAERVLHTARLDDATFPAIESALLSMAYAGDAGRAARLCEAAAADAAQRGATTWQAVLTGLHAQIALRQGGMAAAEERARAALALLPAAGWGVGIAGVLAVSVRASVAMGRLDHAADRLRRPVPDDAFQTVFGLRYLAARGHFHLALGSPHTALDDFLACGDAIGSWRADRADRPRWRLGAAEAYLAMGEHKSAKPLLEEEIAGGEPRATGVALRLLASTARLQQRTALLRESLVLLQGGGDRYELARALTDLGRAHEKLGELSRARVIGRQAMGLTAECLAGGEEAAFEPRDAVESPAPSLSDAEHRVASLAAVGYMNREIARKLCITVSTVEQHLTRTYRKLQVNGRSGLSERLGPLAERALRRTPI